ncbi:porin [Paraburkholderia tropica]|uniref:porin n=1 Tax=Paraburkholderia tropica TaxID=92647 RepID=UPI002AAFFCD3|nr:porin [Paraburkholderia tropica]
MKRWHAPLAALGIVVAPSVFAQSSVTLYGIIDSAIQYGNTGGKTTVRQDTSSVAPTRWGLLGTEDLGGGYAAVFKLENGFNVNNGTISGNGALFNREAWVGIRGPFGQIQLGNNYTPLFTTYASYSLGSLNTLGWGNAANNYVFVPAARTANSVRYVSPAIAGLTLRALYARGTNGASGAPPTLGDTASVGLNFQTGAFSADADYLQQRYAPSASVTSETGVSTGRYYLFAARYTFEYVTPALLYEIHRNGGGVTSAISGSYASPSHDFYEVNALIHRIGWASSVLVSFGQYFLKSNGNGDSTSYGLRYEYQLSKRTGVYLGFAEVRNHSKASFTVSNAGGPGITVAAGQNITAGIAGIVHKF